MHSKDAETLAGFFQWEKVEQVSCIWLVYLN